MTPELREKINRLQEEGNEIFHRFDLEVRQKEFHPFVPVNYEEVLQKLLPLQKPGLKFLEWGSGTGVIAIMADLLGFEAYGIELDADLVAIARQLADTYESNARFAVGSFLPEGYTWRDQYGDTRTGTLGKGRSGYLELGIPLEEFDIVYGYPWDGEEAIMLDIMKQYGRKDTLFIQPQREVRTRKTLS